MAYINYYIKFETMTIPYLNQVVKQDSEIIKFLQFCKSEGAIAVEIAVENGSKWIEVFNV